MGSRRAGVLNYSKQPHVRAAGTRIKAPSSPSRSFLLVNCSRFIGRFLVQFRSQFVHISTLSSLLFRRQHALSTYFYIAVQQNDIVALCYT